MALLLHSGSSPFLQDNIQLIIYSRTYSESIKKDIATMPKRGVSSELNLRNGDKCRGEGSRSRGAEEAFQTRCETSSSCFQRSS